MRPGLKKMIYIYILLIIKKMTILTNIKTIQLKENGAPKKSNEWKYIKKKVCLSTILIH